VTVKLKRIISFGENRLSKQGKYRILEQKRKAFG